MKRLNIIKHYGLGVLIMFLVYFLAGCQKPNPIYTQETVTTSFQSTQIFATQLTALATFTSRPYTTPTNTILPTEISVPVRSFTSTPRPIWTPLPILPTLSFVESDAVVMDLLVNNAGCKLPCWWGITPGETTWNEANQFLATFSTIEGPAVQSIENITYEAYAAHFNLDEKKYSIDLINTNGIVIDIGLQPDVTVFDHKLNKLLTSNGQPEEVWLAPMPATPGGSWFYLILYYPEKGIMARYGGSASPIIKIDSSGNAIITAIRICPVSMGPELWLVAPNTLKGVMGNPALGGVEFTNLLIPIQDITEMSLEDFYLTFRNADNYICFETIR